MYKESIKKIADASKRNTLTFFVGAGVSRLSNVKKWSELIDAFCEEMEIPKKDQYSNEECLAIPQKYYNFIKMDDSAYYNFLNKQLSSSAEPNIVHHLLYALKPSSIITTNFDDLLEKAASQNCLSYKAIATDSDVSSINGSKFILKVHGDLKHRNVVLKEEDYLNYSEDFKLIETITKSIFSTNTIVFIGYSLNDYNIRLIMNWAKTLLQDAYIRPIFIYTDEANLSQIDIDYQQSRGLSVIDFRCFLKANASIADVAYEERYSSILNRVLSLTNIDIANKTKEELFECLFEMLRPLDAVFALRRSDLRKKLFPYIIVHENGLIETYSNQPNIIEYFCELMDSEEQRVPHKYEYMYSIICSVFCKANIVACRKNNEYVFFKLPKSTFGDPLCIMHDYFAMQKVIDSSSDNIYDLYKSAFYLARLGRYDASYHKFKTLQ